MKKLLIVTFIVVVFPFAVYAQETTETPLAGGTMSMMFSFGSYGSNMGLTQGAFFSGAPGASMSATSISAQYGIGGRYYLSSQLAIRGTLLFGTTSYDREGHEESFTRFGLAGGAQFHLITSGKASLYAGGMLAIYSGSYSEDGADDLDIMGFGIYGILGAEYYISKNLSIGAEYTLGITKVSTEQGPIDEDYFDFSIQMFSFNLGYHF
mgnify:CR=1 FL=1